MTRKEWEAVCLVLAEAWPGEFTEIAETAYFVILEDFERVEVEAALKGLARQGGVFRPSASEIAGWIAGRSAPPSFDEIWPVVVRAKVRHYADHDALIAAVQAGAGEHAAGWVSTYGPSRLLLEPHDDPDRGGAVLHRLRAHYTELVSTDGGRHRLLTAMEQRRQISTGEPRRLDAARLLGAA